MLWYILWNTYEMIFEITFQILLYNVTSKNKFFSIQIIIQTKFEYYFLFGILIFNKYYLSNDYFNIYFIWIL